MESYQSIAIVLGIVGIILGLISTLVLGPLAWFPIIASFLGIIIPLVNTKHHKNVGIVLIVIGIVGNVLLIIPGIMAIRYKPESESRIKP